MIAFDNASLSFNDKRALVNFSWRAPDCRLLVVTGPSGCGKTTLLRLVAGLAVPDSGSVTAPGGVAYLFQEHRLIPRRSVLENLRLVTGEPMVWLERVGMADSARLYPAQLSGGMRQRVAIARAFAYAAPVLLLDEPMKELDASAAANVLTLLEGQLELRETAVVVTHEPDYFARLGGAVVRLDGLPLRIVE